MCVFIMQVLEMLLRVSLGFFSDDALVPRYVWNQQFDDWYQFSPGSKIRLNLVILRNPATSQAVQGQKFRHVIAVDPAGGHV